MSHCNCKTTVCTCHPAIKSFSEEPIIVEFPAMIKASIIKGNRVMSVEASATVCDAEGDVIMQKALLDSADYFVENGHLDIDHYSELAKNPDFDYLGLGKSEDWIIGKPLSVNDLGNFRTGVKAYIFGNSNEGSAPTNPQAKYEWLWGELMKGQDIWQASVYGFPGSDTEMRGCTEGTDGWVCATRYLVKSFRWCSLALTKNPINQGLENPVRIISAKSYAAKLGNYRPIPKSEPIFNRYEIRKSYIDHINKTCPETHKGSDISVNTLRGHFLKCIHLPYHLADLYALATKELIRRDT